jgi:hypothetical protein
MAELKTKLNDADVPAFLNSVADAKKQADAIAIVNMMEAVTGEPAKMWGNAIVGCGQYHYKYESGHEADMFIIGFSPRKENLTIYIAESFPKREALLAKLGKHKTGKVCLYIKRLADVDEKVLKELMKESVAYMKEKYK